MFGMCATGTMDGETFVRERHFLTHIRSTTVVMSLYSFVGSGCHLPYDISARGSFLKRRRTPKQVLDEIEEKGIAFVDLHLTDVPGRLRHVTIPAEMVSEKTFTDGVAKLDGATWQVSDPFSHSFKISSQESAVEARGTNFPIRFKDGYYPAPPVDTLSEYRSECVTSLRDGFGILCNAHHHEVATAGQCEIDMYRDSLVQMADSVMTYKLVTKNVASRRGLIAPTKPKPILGGNAVGMHTPSG